MTIAMPVISELGLTRDVLKGRTVVVTGAGGGIGYEAARALLWLGANVAIAEIDDSKGRAAEAALQAEFGAEHVVFVHTDVGDEASVANLFNVSASVFGRVDVVINNATVAVLGKVIDVPIGEWDRSYQVNLRGPVLMARAFLPAMIQRREGTFVCVSSTGTAFLGGYETFKAAQLHLGDTLDAELEGTGVIAYTIGPGLVPTETASRAVAQLAPLMGMSADAFFEMNKGAVLSVEEAGAGFAASVVFAARFRGQEISSAQALRAASREFGSALGQNAPAAIDAEARNRARRLCAAVLSTLKDQAEGWQTRSLFERQWVKRDFKKATGMPVEEWLAALERLHESLAGAGGADAPPLPRLADYYTHLADLAAGYEKDTVRLQEQLRHVHRWRDEVNDLLREIRT
jgi:NAD(P)-dependent dehydrogenase (short-subunit alcohol dehydrogenase family)